MDLAIYSFDELGEGKQFTSTIYMTKYQKQTNEQTSKKTQKANKKHQNSKNKPYLYQYI